MKNVFFLFFLLYNIAANAEYIDENTIKIQIGSVSIENKQHNLYVLTTIDSTRIEAVAFSPTKNFSNYYDFYYKDIVIPYTNNNLQKLKEILEKYKEWTIVAKDNEVGHMQKIVDIEIPDMYIHLYETKNSKITTNFHVILNDKRFCFTVPATRNKDPMLYINFQGKDIEKKSKELLASLYFYSTKELEDFVEFIQPNNLYNRLKNKTIDKLFK